MTNVAIAADCVLLFLFGVRAVLAAHRSSAPGGFCGFAIGTFPRSSPSGGIKSREYQVELHRSPDVVKQFNSLPVKKLNGSVIYLRDVTHVQYAVQANIVLRTENAHHCLPY